MDYEDGLDRALERTPEIEGGGNRFEVPEPEVRQEGNATVVENFQSIADRLGRDPEDVLKGLQSELGTNAGIDESGRARLTGAFDRDRVADAVEAYTDAFVLCPECGLPDTRLGTERGAEVLRCDACGAVSPAGD